MRIERDLTARDGIRLHGREWRPADDPKAAVTLVHGLAEHGGRYEHVGRFLAGRGFAVTAYDLRGHGKSGGPRIHLRRFDDLLDDLDLVLGDTERGAGSAPRFLFGHSFGGLLVINYVLRREPSLAGVIVNGAGLRTALEQQPLKLAAVRLLGRIVPRLSLPIGIDANTLCRDAAVVKAASADPLMGHRASLGFARCVLGAKAWAIDNAAGWHTPVLVMHGAADLLSFPHGSEEFAAMVKGDCTLKLWPGMYHETHNEPEWEAVLAYAADWIEARLELARQSSGAGGRHGPH